MYVGVLKILGFSISLRFLQLVFQQGGPMPSLKIAHVFCEGAPFSEALKILISCSDKSGFLRAQSLWSYYVTV